MNWLYIIIIIIFTGGTVTVVLSFDCMDVKCVVHYEIYPGFV